MKTTRVKTNITEPIGGKKLIKIKFIYTVVLLEGFLFVGKGITNFPTDVKCPDIC